MTGFFAAMLAAVTLQGPRMVVGDGATVVELTLGVPAGTDPSALTLTASAGTFGEPRAAPGGFAIPWTPPRVVEPLTATLGVVIEGGRRPGATFVVRVGAAPSDSEVRRSGGVLDVAVPGRLILGKDVEATVSLKDPGVPFTLLASAGTLSAPAKGSDGRFTATWKAPAARYPQIAIVAAQSGSGEILDWAAIRLVGQAKVETTAKPDSMVTVRLGDETYGPLRASGGKADFPVLVPPGIDVATAIAVDRFKATKETRIALGTPPANRLLGACVEKAGRVVAVVVGADGAPATGVTFDRKASPAGILLEPRTTAPGVYEMDLQVPAGVLDASISVEAAVAGDAASRVRCSLPLPPLPATSIALSLDRASWAAGSGTAVVVKLLPTFSGKRLPRATTVELSADLGTFVPAKVDVAGPVQTVWKLPNALGGRTTATVTAKSADGSLSATGLLRLDGGAASALEISLEPNRLKADGTSAGEIRVVVKDAFGNPVPPKGALSATVPGGEVTAFAADAGQFRARYVSPVLFKRAEQTIAVKDGGSAQGTVAVTLLPTRRRFSLAARAGYLTNLGKISAPLVCLGTSFRPRALSQRFAVDLEGSFYQANAQSDAGSETLDLSVRAVPVLARVRYDVTTGALPIFVGLESGAFLARTEATSASTGREIREDIWPAFGATAGSDLPLGPGQVTAQVSFWSAQMETTALEGNLGGVSLTAGYRLDF